MVRPSVWSPTRRAKVPPCSSHNRGRLVKVRGRLPLCCRSPGSWLAVVQPRARSTPRPRPSETAWPYPPHSSFPRCDDNRPRTADMFVRLSSVHPCVVLPAATPEEKIRFAFNNLVSGNQNAASALTTSTRGHTCMASPEELRGYATRCLTLAQRADDPNDKARLLQMAEAWRQLAEKAAAKAPAEPSNVESPSRSSGNTG